MNESVVRTLSGIIYILLLVTATVLSPLSFVILFGLFLMLAVLEFCKLVQLKTTTPIIMAVAGFVLFGCIVNNDPWTNFLLTAGALFISVVLVSDLFNKRSAIITDNTTKLARLTGYIILPYLLMIKLPFLTGKFDPYILVGIFVLMWTNDTFAYVVGKTMGKHKLFERISPKKTIEGFAGGLIFTLLGSFILSRYNDSLTPVQWCISAAILVFFGTLGDLVESKLKRIAGVKDSGNIMPGHGGVLDRQDSIIFAIPFLFLYYQLLHYVS